MELSMMPQSQRVLRDALELTPTDRAEFVEQILASCAFPARKEVDTRWAREVESRLYAYERGKIEAIPAEEIFGRIDRLEAKTT